MQQLFLFAVFVVGGGVAEKGKGQGEGQGREMHVLCVCVCSVCCVLSGRW